MRPQSRLAGSQNCGAIFQHLKLDMTLVYVFSKYIFILTKLQEILSVGKVFNTRKISTAFSFSLLHGSPIVYDRREQIRRFVFSGSAFFSNKLTRFP